MARSTTKCDCDRPAQECERCFAPPQRHVVQAFVDRGRAAWLDVVVSAEALAESLARLEQRDGRSAEDRLDHASDLYLACACAAGDRRALAAFDAHFLTRVDAFVARINPSPEFAAEVRQQLRVRLLVADGGATPRIGDYAGQGPLGAWLRMAATRIALDLSRATAVQLEPQRVPDLEDGVPPDVQLLRKRYAAEFQAALREAWAALTVRERSVLRLCLVDGSTAEEVGMVFHVHRVTVTRWISAARQRMMDLTLQIVGERLRLPRAELQSIAQLIRSELDLRISQFAIAS